MPIRPDEMEDVRRVIREEIALALAAAAEKVKAPKKVEPEADIPVAKKAKKVVRKKGW